MYEIGRRRIPKDVIDAIQAAFPDGPPPPIAYSDVDRSGTLFVKEDSRIFVLPYGGVIPSTAQQEASTMRPIEKRFTGEGRFLRQIAGNTASPFLRERDTTVWQADRSPKHGLIVLARRLSDGRQMARLLAFDDTKAVDVFRQLEPSADPTTDDEQWEPIARLVGVIRQTDGPERTWFWEPGLTPEHLMEGT